MAIGASVGRNGVNELADVLVVQHLLNDWLTAIRQPLVPTKGICGPMTIETIEAFQSRILGSTAPDGRIDPGGKTWNALIARNFTPAPARAPTPAPAGTSGFSGTAWWQANQGRFPNSAGVADLVPAFRDKVTAFIAALKDAGATVKVSATRRNRTRAQLMHYCWRIANNDIAPKDVPAIAGCDIKWDHGSLARSKQGAQEMVDLFGIVHRPSLTSLHIEGRAIDMTITWTGTMQVRDQAGVRRTIGAPRSGDANRDLHAVGATYGVLKLLGDAPHWSDNGH